ncbi:hypothetical protein B0H10DRAFT_2001330 [Mycena sp. CBHHK59/15]|nr:hypothetical protein B0H10DRAFT_2001330 [Mycena sp. CBHHK59/15]
MDTPKRVESEMSKYQRELVDVCLEEGQYESAIDLLGQLRSPSHKPSAAHIRQLLFIALYSGFSDAGQDTCYGDRPASPSKKPKKSHLFPSPAATLAAQRLLISFAITNSPAALIRSLNPSDEDLDGDQSLIATESMNQAIFSTVKGTGKRREVDLSFDASSSELRAPVGETAWPVLDWLLLIFEQDERGNSTFPRHSPLLLEHLGTPSRRETDAPLAILLHCARLLNLLINLSSTTHLDFPMLVVSVFNCLSILSLDDISLLLFKIALYQRYFGDSNDPTRAGSRPRPQARAQPKGSPVKARNPTQPVSLVSKYPMPSSAEILRLMEVNTMKFELLVSYNAFQTDPEWPICYTLDAAFGCKGEATADGSSYRELLETILNVY